MNALFRAVLQIKNTQECARFFRDLMTIEEIREMSQRWNAAQLLDKGMTYREVAAQTRMSTTTVARIAFWLRDGEGGYRLVLDRIKKTGQKKNVHHHHVHRSYEQRS